MYTIQELLAKTNDFKASDLHITVGRPPTYRIHGDLVDLPDGYVMRPEVIEGYIQELLDDLQYDRLKLNKQLDMTYPLPGIGRYRINIYMQRGAYTIAARQIPIEIPTIKNLNLPPILEEISLKKRGLFLVTGPTGSGKSTTLAAMIEHINDNRRCNIITLEDPIEFLHRHKKSLINQREMGFDAQSFSEGLKAVLRQDPDVILVGEMRDLESIAIAITAAETGHLVLSTLHTNDSVSTIDRIIDVFPPTQQQQVRIQLSNVLIGVMSQQLLKKKDNKGRIMAHEIMLANPAIRNMIREGKTHQMMNVLQTSSSIGMETMDTTLLTLYNKGIITRDDAMLHAIDLVTMEKLLR